MHVGISIQSLRPDVARAVSLLQTLIAYEKEIHIDGMSFSGVTHIHRTKIRVAAHLDLLELLFVVENRSERVAAHDVLFLFSRRAAGKRQPHRRLLKDSLG